MYYILVGVLVGFVLVNISMAAVSVMPPQSGGINQYCQLKKMISPQISDLDLVMSVFLNSGEMISISPDKELLSNYYKFSAKDKDVFLAAYLNGMDATIRRELLREKIKEVAGSEIPENCAVAMTRLGLEDVFNKRRVGNYSVDIHDKRMLVTNDCVEVSFALSVKSVTGGIVEELPKKVEVGGGSGDGADDVVVMLRGKDYFRIIERGAKSNLSMYYCSRGEVYVYVVFPMSDISEKVKLLCHIPYVGVYGIDL